MTRNDNALNVLLLIAAIAVAVGYFVPRYVEAPARGIANVSGAQTGSASAPATASVVIASGPGAGLPTPGQAWVVAAPGRVEPNGGEIRISAEAPGKIVEVLAAINDRVVAGDLLARIDDADAESRVAAAYSEIGVRKRERDGEAPVGNAARERRAAEDALINAERAANNALADFDRKFRAGKTGEAQAADVQTAREALKAARERVEQAKATLRRLTSAENAPTQTRLEAAVTAAHADLLLAHSALERTRIRAPQDGTVLQVSATRGELAAPSAEQVMFLLGDVSKLRVRAEVEERDVGKIRPGQLVVVRSDAFQGQSFQGRIGTIASTLGPGKLTLKGPRRGIEVDTLEVMIDLDGTPPLLPGMRVDVLVKPAE